jgi:hypothetical protein
VVCLLTANLSLSFATTRQWSVSQSATISSLARSSSVFCLLIRDHSGCESSHQKRSKCTYECFGGETSCYLRLNVSMWQSLLF